MYIQKFKPYTCLNRHYKNSLYFNFLSFNFWYFKRFLNNKSGRNNKGSIIIFTKKKRRNLWFIKNTFSLWNYQTALIINFKYFILKGLFFLLKYCNGSISLIKSIYGLFLGNYIYNFFCFLKKLKLTFLGLQCLIIFTQKYLFISNIKIESQRFNIYSSSNGCYSQILDFFFELNLVKIRLSSGIQKIINGNSICIIGRNNNIYHKYIVYGGYKWSNYLGKKSIVRGVAMNPIDHPHGGRTKTNKPEVSPWNWVTKYSH